MATEVRTGYDRNLFPHWVDADGDGCSTRNEVLLAEADDPPSVGADCTLTGGRWFSYYDRVSSTARPALDIDHMVALAEAWDSGARTWTTADPAALRQRPRRLPLAGRGDRLVNQVQGRPGPRRVAAGAASSAATCSEWVAVKHRWRLKVDSAEKSTLRSLAAGVHQHDDHGHARAR